MLKRKLKHHEAIHFWHPGRVESLGQESSENRPDLKYSLAERGVEGQRLEFTSNRILDGLGLSGELHIQGIR